MTRVRVRAWQFVGVNSLAVQNPPWRAGLRAKVTNCDRLWSQFKGSADCVV